MELSYAAQILVWVSIYYFTFEILLVKTTLLNKDSILRKRLIFIIKIMMIAAMITFGALALQANINSVFTDDHPNLMFYYIDQSILFLSIKLFLDTCIEILFVTLVVFMINFKRKNYKLTKANYIVILWTTLLFLMCCF